MKLPYIKIEQPIGTFYLTSISAKILIEIVDVRKRTPEDLEGVQRALSRKRVTRISEFCKESDAVFPTPIVVSVNLDVPYTVRPSESIIELPDGREIGQVIDGQHRLWGIKESGLANDFELPVVLMFELTAEENAYVFSIINSTQTKVDKSLIYDLFELSTYRSPQRTCHELARALNSGKESPFYNRLKMLGKKEIGQPNAVLSQGTFVKQMLQLITKDPESDASAIKSGRPLYDDPRLPLRKYFINEQDDVIYKVLLNTFNALKHNFREEWTTPDNNILWKTTGFCGVMIALNYLLRKGVSERTLSYSFFDKIFAQFKTYIERKGISLTSRDFPGGGLQNQKKFANILVEAIDEVNNSDILANKNVDEDYKQFIDAIFETLDDEEKYELAEAVGGVSVNLNAFNVRDEGSRLIISYPFADLTLVLPKTDIAECVRWMQDKYFDGLDYNAWFSIEKAMEKDE